MFRTSVFFQQRVYVANHIYSDMFNYTGWIIGFKATNAQIVTAFSTISGPSAPLQDGTLTGGGGGAGSK